MFACLNGLIWKRCPKDVYVGQQTLELGVSSAVISFNEGMNSILKVMQHYGMSEVYFTNRYCNNKDAKRIGLYKGSEKKKMCRTERVLRQRQGKGRRCIWGLSV